MKNLERVIGELQRHLRQVLFAWEVDDAHRGAERVDRIGGDERSHDERDEVSRHLDRVGEAHAAQAVGEVFRGDLARVRDREHVLRHDERVAEDRFQVRFVEAGEGPSRVGLFEVGRRDGAFVARVIDVTTAVEAEQQVVENPRELRRHRVPAGFEYGRRDEVDALFLRLQLDLRRGGLAGIIDGHPSGADCRFGDREVRRVHHDLAGLLGDRDLDAFLSCKGRRVEVRREFEVVADRKRGSGQSIGRETLVLSHGRCRLPDVGSFEGRTPSGASARQYCESVTTLARAASARAEQERRRYDVCCVGNALMDHLAYADLATVAALGLDHGGMTLVDIATTDQLKAVIGNGRQVPGGTVTNTAVGVASLGGRPVFIGAVATDETGDQYAADLEAAGVHAVLQRFPFDPDGHEMATGRCYVIVTPDAERTMATALGVGGQLNAAGVDEAVIAQSMLVYFDGYVLDLPDARALVDRLLGAGRAAGTAVAVGLADSRLVERHRGVLEDLCREGVEYIFANESEILEFTKTSGVDRAVRAVARDDLVVAVTRGARGATVGFDHCVVDVPAHLVENVADVTGAGDLFAAGFCYGVTHGLDPVAAAELGSLAAAEVISHLGARPETSLADLARARSLI